MREILSRIKAIVRRAFALSGFRPRQETTRYPRLMTRRNGRFYLKHSPYESTSLKTRDPIEARRLFNLEIERLKARRGEIERKVLSIGLGEFRVEYLNVQWKKVLKGQRSDASLKNDKLAFLRFHEAVGDVALRQISRQDVIRFRETFLEGAEDSQRAMRYANSLMGHLRAAFYYALKKGYIDHNPFSESSIRGSVFFDLNPEEKKIAAGGRRP